MGYPRRFFGSDRTIEFNGVTIPPNCTVEVTIRTHQQALLLRPDPEATEILLGCFGRAQDRYPDLNVHVLDARSNHVTFLATPTLPSVLASFMRDFLSTAAKRLNKLRGREGTFWERRYRAIPAIDEDAIEDRFRYVLTQGTKENLVWRARDWPGVTSTRALLGGAPLVGRWRDVTAEYELQRQADRRGANDGERSSRRGPAPVWKEYLIRLVPLPHWAHLKPGQLRAKVAAILHDDDRKTKERHERDGTRPLGVAAVLAADPHSRPRDSKKGPAPLCHASTRAARTAFRCAYRLFVESMRAAARALAESLATAGFPVGCTSPPLQHRSSQPSDDAMIALSDVLDRCEATGPPATAAT
jgi:putative transposase